MATLLSNEDKYYWYVEGERLAIVEKKSAGSITADPDWDSPTIGGENLRVKYTAKAVPFTIDTMTTSSEIPSQFHEALAIKVIADLYTLPGEKFNLQLAQYFAQQYTLHIREGKKYSRRNHVRGGRINPHSY